MVASRHKRDHLKKLVDLIKTGRWIPALARVVVHRRPDMSHVLIDGEHTLTAIGMQVDPVEVVVSVLSGTDEKATEAYAHVGLVDRARTFALRAMAVALPFPGSENQAGAWSR